MKVHKFSVLLLLFLVNSCQASVLSDTSIIKSHLAYLTKTTSFRTFDNPQELNRTADYIQGVFKQYSDAVSLQEFSVKGIKYKNVICSFGMENPKRIIVGAHYDVCGEQAGADDNASGITGLLELARLLKGQKLNYRVDLVAYSLEEPPYFRTHFMGSYFHAKSLADSNENVFGMVSLEMIGFYAYNRKSQKYPFAPLSLIYGNKGDYITLVKKFGAGKFTRKFSKSFKQSETIKTKKFAAPRFLPGIDFSDHFNYWDFGFSALMITDTAFYRNKNYHLETDTMETLDIKSMAKVIDGVFSALISL